MSRKIPITITVDSEIFERFKKLCERNDIKVSTKINTLIKEWLENNNFRSKN